MFVMFLNFPLKKRQYRGLTSQFNQVFPTMYTRNTRQCDRFDLEIDTMSTHFPLSAGGRARRSRDLKRQSQFEMNKIVRMCIYTI
jgi:hypothetical protein